MQTITTIGLDIAKSVFQVHGQDDAGQVVIRRQLKRRSVLAFFQKLPPCLVGIEACASAHHWSRELLEATLIKAINPSQNRQAPHCGRDGRQPHHRLDAAIISGGGIMKRKPVSPMRPKRCLPTMEA